VAPARARSAGIRTLFQRTHDAFDVALASGILPGSLSTHCRARKQMRPPGRGRTYSASIVGSASSRRSKLDDEISPVYGYAANHGRNTYGNLRP
jgi:hypothetical protein